MGEEEFTFPIEPFDMRSDLEVMTLGVNGSSIVEYYTLFFDSCGLRHRLKALLDVVTLSKWHLQKA